MTVRDRVARRLTRFARDESGAITVEAVLWLPFFFAILILIVDVSLAFYAKAQAFRTIENGNRAFAVGRASFQSTAATQTWIDNALAGLSPNATVSTTCISGTGAACDGGLVSTTVVMPARDIMMFNLSGIIGDFNMTVRAQQYVE
jgi:Flp pilus assembly protein TadG